MKPILFSTEMTKAILDGRKSATRRVIKPQPPEGYILAGIITDTTSGNKDIGKIAFTDLDYKDSHLYKPAYALGDILYVRETWKCVQLPHPSERDSYTYLYKASGWHLDSWKPSIHMPKDAARIFLKVTDVKVERLQDISEEDAKSEGIGTPLFTSSAIEDLGYRECFFDLWDSIYNNSHENPWIFAYTFERTDCHE